ncbi:methionyl-tRNA formyltransferase [Firmicutes bacterium AF25-13AC]|nr:methionyl-tRNA formyltransferase [Firmicutes bacterium AF25-13AC]
MRIIFMGTPDFAVPVLQSLINSRHEVVAVVTQPDRPKGRGKNMQFSPVKECALAHNIPVMQPVNVSVPEVIDELRAYEPELIVVVAFGQFVTKKIREMPKYGCINVHASLLPKYRGAGPIQWAVINGEKESGVTTMYMCREIDKGDMLLKDTVTLDPKETGDSLHDKLSMMGGPLLLKTIDQLEDGSAVRIPQCEEESTYAPKLEKTMGNIDWTMDADRIERLVRGLNSWPGTFTKIHGKTVKIWDCDVVCQEALTESQAAAEPGTVIISEKDQLIVKAGNGALSLRMLQPEGKKNMTVDAYLRGYPIAQGELFTQV